MYIALNDTRPPEGQGGSFQIRISMHRRSPFSPLVRRGAACVRTYATGFPFTLPALSFRCAAWFMMHVCNYRPRFQKDTKRFAAFVRTQSFRSARTHECTIFLFRGEHGFSDEVEPVLVVLSLTNSRDRRHKSPLAVHPETAQPSPIAYRGMLCRVFV